jgi:hypothetical protein
MDASPDGAGTDGGPPVHDSGMHDATRPDAEQPPDGAVDPDSGAGFLGMPEAQPPHRIGTLVGPGSRTVAPNLRVYGTDLGITFEHDGQHKILFGDTWTDEEQVCRDAPLNDDTLATLPLELGDSVPDVSFETRPDSPDDARAMRLLRGESSLSMGFGQVPMAAFSDGDTAFAFFARLAPQACTDVTSGPQCPLDEGLGCSDRIGECQPAVTTMTLSCDLASSLGCLPGQECVEGPPICVDSSSAQYDGSIFGETSAIAQQVELAVQSEDAIEDFHSVLTWPTSKFATLSARTVEHFSGARAGNDYGGGHGELLVWGRPGFVGEHGREAQLYFMRHSLPIERSASGAAVFTPSYFAGLDPATGEPTWTDAQGEAEPLALDGEPDGDPHEALNFTGQMAMSWLPAPINRWVMLYGGDMTDFLMVDGPAMRAPRAPGAIVLRFAEHPWGPWTAPVPHLSPGAPHLEGTHYAAGGLLFHPDCVDAGEKRCAVSDPWRPTDTATACLVQTNALDQGRLYGVNIIDRYTEPNDVGGVDFVWNVSTWNPYGVTLMRTRVVPPASDTSYGELSDARGLERMGDFASLPVLEPGSRYRQQSSKDRGTGDTSFPLSGGGNRDFNNFLCKSPDTQMAPDQFAPFKFDEATCEEDYVRGAVLARFEGPGRLVRTWIGMASLLFGPADEEVLRIYVDDQPEPLIEERLADVLDGSAGEVFAPPFGAGSPRRMSWYYPLAFEKKLVVAIDNLGEFDEYFYHCDVVHDGAAVTEPATRSQRARAFAQLAATYHPSGTLQALVPHHPIEIAAGATGEIELEGPATIGELELRVLESDLAALANVTLRVHWDGAATAAIDLPLIDLFAVGGVPPETSSLPLTSFAELDTRFMVLKLPMPFASSARFALHNQGSAAARFELAMYGTDALPAHDPDASDDIGKLHVIRSSTEAPTALTEHESFDLEGRGRLAGLCIAVEGAPDPEGGLQSDGLNLLEGDIRIWTDGALALDGTGTEEYADDVFYFTDAPHATPFVQAWGVINDPNVSATGHASLCRWHVLGTELDFEESLRASFERGGAGNPEIALRHRTVAYVYLAD